MRNSDPRVIIVFVYRFNSNFHSTFTLYATSCNFKYGPNFGVPSDPTFRFRSFLISWQSVLTTNPDSVNCENSSVSFVMKYCPTSTVVRNTASVQNLITRFRCDSLSTRSWYFLQEIFLRKIIGRRCRNFDQRTCRHKQWVRLSCQHKSPCSYTAVFAFFTQTSNCSVHTELINRKFV